VREVMRSKVVALLATDTVGELQEVLRAEHRQTQRLLPVVNAEGQLAGVVTRADIRKRLGAEGEVVLQRSIGELVRPEVVEAYPDEPLRIVVYRMAEKGLTRLPVVERKGRKFLGLIALDDLLKARGRNLEEERTRERVLNVRFFSARG
jgi:CBS domain-containing protein